MSFTQLTDEQSVPIHEEENRPRRRLPTFVWPTVIVLVGVCVVVGLVLTSVVGNAALDGRDALVRAKVAFENSDLLAAEEELARAEKSFGKAYRGSWWLMPVSLLPVVGESYRPLRAVMKTGQDLSNIFGGVMGEVLDVFRLVPETEALWPWHGKVGDLLELWPDIDEETRRLLLSRLRALVPSLELAKTDVAILEHFLSEETSSVFLGPFASSRDRLEVLVANLSTVLDEAVGWAAIGPELAGADGVSHILILLLNNSELRPGGGFIGSFAVANMEAGLLRDLKHFDVMALDGAASDAWDKEPPKPISEYLGVPSWYLRDANWSPDMPASFAHALAFYEGERAVGGAEVSDIPAAPFTAVLGITVTFAQDLLRVVGPVTVDQETFTAENIPEALNESVEFGFVGRGLPPSRRKEIIAKMLLEVADRLVHLSPTEWNEVLAATKIRAMEKHLMLWSEEPKRQQLFERFGISGALQVPKDGQDALMVVDANLASLKTDPAIERHLTYALEPQENGDIYATASMRYRHTKPFSKTVTRYRTFTRFFTPLGSELLSVEGSLSDDKLKNPSKKPDTPEVTDEDGYRVFGAFISVEPETEATLTVRYKLPAVIVEQVKKSGRYEFLLPKQPGVSEFGLTLDLLFDTKLSRAEPPEEGSEWGDRRYRLNTNVRQDSAYVVELSASEDRY